MRYACSESP